MDFYPAELSSPPVPLVALIGQPSLHLTVGDYLRTQNVPRLHAVGIADPHSAAGTFGSKKQGVSSGPPAGILKAGWLSKHRSTRPAVAAMFVERQAVVGDPSSWAWLVSQLDAVRAAARPRGVRIVVIVLLPGPLGPGTEVPEDRVAMICRQAGVERRCVLMYAPSEGLPALQVIGRVLHEQATLYYTQDAQRRLATHASRNVPAPELNLRTAFKLGTLAEFRADWAAALKMYREAYAYLPQVLSGASMPMQRFVEVKAEAEWVHIKILSLLLLALKQLPDACVQFEAHIRTFRRVPLEPLPGLLGNHHGWLCRQYMVMAELLLSSSIDLGSLRADQQPAQLYLAAASAAIERRKVSSFIRGMHGAGGPAPPAGVRPGLYVGQLAQGDPPRRLTDEQFVAHLDAEELSYPHSKTTLDLLLTARDAIKRSGARAGRMLHHVTLLLGQEHLQGGQPAPAQRLLSEVAAYYRRQGWQAPLAHALLLLRDCAHALQQPAEHAACSLEAAALDSTMDAAQRQAMAGAALMTLLSPAKPGEAAADQHQQEGQQQQQQQQWLDYAIETPDSGWLRVLAISCCFLQSSASNLAGMQQQQQQQQGPEAPVLAVGLWNNLPVDLPITAAEATLRDQLGTFTVPLALNCSRGSSISASVGSSAGPPTAGEATEGGGASSSGESVAKAPGGGWLRLLAEVQARCSGPLQAVSIRLHLGPCSSLIYQLGGLPAPKGAVAVGMLKGGYASSVLPFGRAAGFVPGRYSTEVPPRHQPPLLRLEAPAAALQGETLSATVMITASSEAVATARLAVRALHRDSQLLLPVTPAPGQSLQQAPQQQASQPQPEGWALPELAPGQSLSLRFTLPVPRRGSVDLRAALQYATAAAPAPGSSSAGSGNGAGEGSRAEAGKAVAGLVIPVDKPLKLELKLLGPPHTHTLLAAVPATPAPSAASSSQSEMPADGLLSASVQGLSLQDTSSTAAGFPPASGAGSAPSSAPGSAVSSPSKAAAAAAAGGMGAADSTDIAALLARDLPSRYVLPAAQDCVAAGVLQATSDTQIDIIDVSLQPSTSAAAASVPGSPTTVPRVQVSGAAGAPSAERPASLGKGDVLTALFSLRCSGPAELPSLGQLTVRWRRHGPPRQQARSVRGLAVEEEQQRQQEAGERASSGAAAGEEQQQVVEATVQLPAASFRPLLLTARASWPAAGAEMGQALPLELRIKNCSSAVGLDVGVAVGEPRGFLLAGPKTDSHYLLPRTSASLAWEAVPYHTGFLQLPQVTVTVNGVGQAAEVTAGCQVFVQHQQQEAASPGTHALV